MERRFKILLLRTQLLVDFFNWWRDPPQWMALPVRDELPEDCTVVAVNYSLHRNCLEAIVQSESFPPVPDGEMIPVIEGGCCQEFRYVRIGKVEEVGSCE